MEENTVYEYEDPDAIHEAEMACFNALCSLLEKSPNRDAFIGLNPGVPDCMVFDIGESGVGDTFCYRAGRLHFHAFAEFFSRDRVALQRTELNLLRSFPAGGYNTGTLPELEGTNVELFRLSGFQTSFGRITPTEIDGQNGKRYNPLLLQIAFDVVFKI